MSPNVRRIVAELVGRVKRPLRDDVKLMVIEQSNFDGSIPCERRIDAIFKIVSKRRTDLEELIPKLNQTAAGFIYLIEHELFDGWIKCGMTEDLTSRLKSYNWCDPMQRFSVLANKSVVDRRKSERLLIHNVKLKADLQKGEWFRIERSSAQQIFSQIN